MKYYINKLKNQNSIAINFVKSLDTTEDTIENIILQLKADHTDQLSIVIDNNICILFMDESEIKLTDEIEIYTGNINRITKISETGELKKQKINRPYSFIAGRSYILASLLENRENIKKFNIQINLLNNTDIVYMDEAIYNKYSLTHSTEAQILLIANEIKELMDSNITRQNMILKDALIQRKEQNDNTKNIENEGKEDNDSITESRQEIISRAVSNSFRGRVQTLRSKDRQRNNDGNQLSDEIPEYIKHKLQKN
jgi:hypothetical protein